MPAQYIQKLPTVFQTVTEKKFFDATFDQVFQKKESDLLVGFLGRREPGHYNPITDFYLPEPSKNRTWWQLEPTAYARDADTNRTNIFFYEDLLDNIEYYEGNTLNQDRLFESEYYSFGPPIDYDMFLNYQNYYWIDQGLPVINISGVTYSEIQGNYSFTTGPNDNPPNLKLISGMTIALLDDPIYNTPFTLENFGGCIGFALVPPPIDITLGTTFEFLPWDGIKILPSGRIIDNSKWDSNLPGFSSTWDIAGSSEFGSDYITIERGAKDNNAWSRTNKWFHISAINETINITKSTFPSNALRALRPIIQFVADIPLYKSGTQFKTVISVGFGSTNAGAPYVKTSFDGKTTDYIFTNFHVQITNGDLIVWMNDPASKNTIWKATVASGTNIVTFTSVSTVTQGDIVIITDDGPDNSAKSKESWYISNNTWQEVSNEKISTNQLPLFELLDHNGIALDDTSVYPESSFRGSEIFSYKLNESPNATVDPVLKFPIVYTSAGQSSDIVFQNDLITDRYTYIHDSNLTPIDGYYYYNITSSNVIFNNWNLFDSCPCDENIVGIENFNKFIPTNGQSIFDTSIPTVGIVGSEVHLQVYLNGVLQQEGVGKNYRVTGPTQITFNRALLASDEVVVISFQISGNIPKYQDFVAGPSQTIFITTIPTVPEDPSINKNFIQVFVNGVFQIEGATKNYQVTGLNQITFNNGLLNSEDVIIYGLSTFISPPNYSKSTANSGQSDFTTPFPISPGSLTAEFLQVYLNGVFQIEGATKNYLVTGSNQITFNRRLVAGDDVAIYGAERSLTQLCQKTSRQRVIDKFVVGYGAKLQFKLSVTPYGYQIGGGPLQPLADIIVSVNGNEIKNNENGFTFVEINNRIYIDLRGYLSNILLIPQEIAPVVEAQTYTHELLNPDYPGYFEIPQQLEANPTQEEIGEISTGELIQHFSSIISNQEGFEGSAFGGVNNYLNSPKNRSLGTFILQNLAPALKSMLISSSDDLDFIKGVRFSADEYTKFKNRFLSVAQQLINQKFSALQVNNNTVDISVWVGEILRRLNIAKEFSNAFAYSYMVAQGTPTFSQSFTTPGNALITLLPANYIDLTDPKNIVYLYDLTNPTNEHILIAGIDYDVSITNPIQIKLKLDSGVKNILVTLYQNPLPTYIPSTPTKVGTWGAYIPRIELDTSYTIPVNVIIGHDGSKTVAYNDYRDDLLLDLETRIYNFLQPRYRGEYNIPLRIESIKPGYFRKTRYSRDEFLEVTESYLNKWAAKNKANYRINDYETAITTTPPDQVWKLYNYRSAINTSGVPINLPGNWKGIFQYYYDTYYPDTRPWEMLGFSQEPEWWRIEYGNPILNASGQEVWGSNAAGVHEMYKDIQAGIIREGPTAIYDPDIDPDLTPPANPVKSQKMWERPAIIDSKLVPVDTLGKIRTIEDIFYLDMNSVTIDPWVYGDGGPVEQVWMSTSGYAYSAMEFLYLMRPGPFGELFWDTLGTEFSPGLINVSDSEALVMSNKNWQYVQNDIYQFGIDPFTHEPDLFFAWMRPQNKDQIVHGELINGVIQVRFGYQNWISDRILFLGKDLTTTFGQKIRSLDVSLANKLAGFINKDTTSTYISSATPGSTAGSLIIPSNNFEVLLHKSPVVDTYSYSGIIIRALADGTFVVYGYDLLDSEFITLDRKTDKLIDVSVGGTPAEFRYFEIGATYKPGEIVRYNGIYYSSEATQTVSKFDPAAWHKLKGLPTVGGISVTYKPVSDVTITRYPYGSIITTVQEVFDLMIGWGAYLESQGWKFTEVSQDTNMISDWLASAKQFLFWLNTSWAPDASIQLSPLANSATLVVKRGYPNDVESLSNGVYSILDKYGVAIPPNGTMTDRDGPLINVTPTDVSVGGIYYLQINAAETEHIIIFDNTTSFGDIIYDPLLRARQQRLRFNGFRSNLWYGKMEAPGYLIIEDQLVPNYDTIVDAMRYYYDSNVTIDNPSLEDLGRSLIGYESKNYLDNLEVADDVQYLFYQGVIRQKGTKLAFEKLFRSTKVQGNEIIKVYEEWALKVGDFGNTVEQVSTEFKLVPEQNTGEVIVAKLNFVPSEIGFVKQINILNAENVYTNVPKLIISDPDASPLITWTNFNELATYGIGDIVKRVNLSGVPIFYSKRNSTGPGPFIPEDWDIFFVTRVAKAYVVLDGNGRIARVDISDPGFGYLVAPTVTIDSGTEPHDLDELYAVWQGAILPDPTLDNIINIDIDDVTKWVVRPIEPSIALEFPLTDKIEYTLPNSGYANFNDVDFSIFSVEQLTAAWGTTSFNPIKNNTVWVANTFTEDWGVYKMFDISAASGFDVVVGDGDQLFVRTRLPYAIIPQFIEIPGVNDHKTFFGNMISLYVNEAMAVAEIDNGLLTTATAEAVVPFAAAATSIISGGKVSDINLTSAGYGYTTPPLVDIQHHTRATAKVNSIAGGVIGPITVTSGGTGYVVAPIVNVLGDGVGATATATIASGAVTGVTVTGGAGYTNATIEIGEPTGISALATAELNETSISQITVTEPGTGYPAAPKVTIEAPEGNGTVFEITVTNPGSSYIAVPDVTIANASGSAGTGATAVATLTDGKVSSITITAGGINYTKVNVVIDSPAVSTRATATATLGAGGSIASLTLTNGGWRYTTPPTVTITGGAGTGATATAAISAGKVTGFTITAPGTGYTTPTVSISAPTGSGVITNIEITKTGANYSSPPVVTIYEEPPGIGTGAIAIAEIAGGIVSTITVTAGGAGYGKNTKVKIDPPQLINPATNFALPFVFSEVETANQPVRTATATATAAAGAVSSITVTNGGRGYTTPPVVSISGGSGATANATIINGSVTAINILAGGTGYTTPIVTIVAPPLPQYNYYGLVTLDGTPILSTDIPEFVNFTNLLLFKPMRFLTKDEPLLPEISWLQSGKDKVWVDGINLNPPIWNVFKVGSNIVNSRITKITVTNPGNRYPTPPTVTISPPPASVIPVVSASIIGGKVSSITVTVGGSYYITAPIVTFFGSGTGAAATAVVVNGTVTEIKVTAAGSGYLTPPFVSITPPPAPIQATAHSTTSGGSVVSIVVDNPGLGYDYFNPPTVTLLAPPAPGVQATATLINTNVFRTQEKLINTSLFESSNVFNDEGVELVQLPIYDPFKFILPGRAKQNLSYISLRDPARYNVTGDERLFSDIIIFGENQVGKLWWDLSNTRYVYYEQPIAQDGSETETDNLIYRRDHWGQLFPGSTVAIYEWTKSPVPPSEYIGPGIPRDVTSYVQISTSNRFTSITETNYYFWVRGSTELPNIKNRTEAAVDVARLLQNPKGQGFAFFSPIQQTETNNSYMFSNVQEILAYQGDNIQVQYRLSERDDQEHTQWTLFRESDPNSIVTDQFWNKMVDSITGYTKELPISDEWDNGITVSETGEVLPVPDPTLSEREKYGVKYRPRQGMFVRLQDARKILVQAANELLKHIPIRDNNLGWRAGVLTDEFWTYTNWYALGYEDAVPTVVFQTLTQANQALNAGALTKDTIVQVLDGTIDGRYILYVVIQANPNIPILSLTEIGIENSSIKLLDTMYTIINRYELSVELRQLLDAFRTEVMVNEFLVDQNELFFSMVNYVLSEQKTPDWVFKTSYIFIKEDNIPLTQSQLFVPDQIGNIIDYIKDVKPYHTQIRSYASSYETMDIATGSVTEETVDYVMNSGTGWDFGVSAVPPNNTGGQDRWDTRPWSEVFPSSRGSLFPPP